MKLKAPFPWFGGKSRVASVVWERFGVVANYVEPFFGSGAVLLARPHAPRVETVNDLDCFVANFWRAIAKDPEATAAAADWPVNEADLHARHRRLHEWVRDAGGMDAWRKRFHEDPDYCEPWLAGWWAWGLSCWIGDNWCRVEPQEAKPDIAGNSKGRGVLSESVCLSRVEAKRPIADGKRNGNGLNSLDISGGFAGDETGLDDRRPHLTGSNGIHAIEKRPMLSGHGRGVGIHSMGHQKIPDVDGRGRGKGLGGLYAYFERLQARLRRVRVCCGDWSRVLGPSVTTCHGATAVFFDPPYGVADRDKVYNADSLDVAGQVRAWCYEHGCDRKLRVALCGYEGEHNGLEEAGWRKVVWKATGGYGSRNQENKNATRERIWFSPHCLQVELFESLTA